MPVIGHNSASFGETFESERSSFFGDDATPFNHANLHLGDYITGTIGMSPEEEGIYIRFLVRLYKQGKPLQDDDVFMARFMVLDVRVWRRIRDSLVNRGKILVRGGCLTNTRFEKERKKRAEWLKKSSAAASERWDKSRPKKTKVAGTESTLLPNLSGTSSKSSPEVSPKSEDKLSKNNDLGVKPHVTPLSYTLKEEDSVTKVTGDEAPSKTIRDLLWGEVKTWLCKASGQTEEKLRPRIGKWASQFGEGAVITAICQAQKNQPIDPVTYIDGILNGTAKKSPGRSNGNGYQSEEDQKAKQRRELDLLMGGRS